MLTISLQVHKSTRRIKNIPENLLDSNDVRRLPNQVLTAVHRQNLAGHARRIEEEFQRPDNLFRV